MSNTTCLADTTFLANTTQGWHPCTVHMCDAAHSGARPVPRPPAPARPRGAIVRPPPAPWRSRRPWRPPRRRAWRTRPPGAPCRPAPAPRWWPPSPATPRSAPSPGRTPPLRKFSVDAWRESGFGGTPAARIGWGQRGAKYTGTESENGDFRRLGCWSRPRAGVTELMGPDGPDIVSASRARRKAWSGTAPTHRAGCGRSCWQWSGRFPWPWARRFRRPEPRLHAWPRMKTSSA